MRCFNHTQFVGIHIVLCFIAYWRKKENIYLYIIILLLQKMQSNRKHGNCCLFDSITSNLPMMPCSLIPGKNK